MREEGEEVKCILTAPNAGGRVEKQLFYHQKGGREHGTLERGKRGDVHVNKSFSQTLFFWGGEESF